MNYNIIIPKKGKNEFKINALILNLLFLFWNNNVIVRTTVKKGLSLPLYSCRVSDIYLKMANWTAEACYNV